MKIEYREGNLLTSNLVHIGQCCNARGKMGSGIAKAIREQYPDNYATYRNAYERDLSQGHQHAEMGTVVVHEADDGRVIYNIIGQQNYGYDGRRYVSYDALATAFERLDSEASQRGMDHLGLPLIGAGLAGGKWSIIKSIIETHSSNFKPVVFVLEGTEIPN